MLCKSAHEVDRHKTAFSSAKLLAYIAAITLHIDEFSVDLTTVARDLEMDVKRYESIAPFMSLNAKFQQQCGGNL